MDRWTRKMVATAGDGRRARTNAIALLTMLLCIVPISLPPAYANTSASTSFTITALQRLEGSVQIEGDDDDDETLTAVVRANAPDPLFYQWYRAEADEERTLLQEGIDECYLLVPDDLEKEIILVVSDPTGTYPGELTATYTAPPPLLLMRGPLAEMGDDVLLALLISVCALSFALILICCAVRRHRRRYDDEKENR